MVLFKKEFTAISLARRPEPCAAILVKSRRAGPPHRIAEDLRMPAPERLRMGTMLPVRTDCLEWVTENNSANNDLLAIS